MRLSSFRYCQTGDELRPERRPLSFLAAIKELIPRLCTSLSCGPGKSARKNHQSPVPAGSAGRDRKSTRLNSSHGYISYAVFCLKKKKDSHHRSNSITCHVKQLTYL